MNLSRPLIAVSVLCFIASASPQPACAQTGHGETSESQNSGNALQFVPGILNAIHDAKKRKDARRKAAAERAKEEQEQQEPVDDAVAEPPAVAPAVSRPVYHPRPVSRPKPRLHHRTPPITQPVLTPTPAPVQASAAPPAVTQPSLTPAPASTPVATPVTPRSPVLDSQAARPMPRTIVPLDELDRGWLLIFFAVAAALGAAAYMFRGTFGFAPPAPTARAFADSGTASAPVFEKDGPQISFVIAQPTFTTTSDYPEQTR